MIYGQATRMSPEAYKYPELRTNLERLISEMMEDKYGTPASTFQWRHEPAHWVDDPETGEPYLVPEQWCLLAETADQITVHEPQ